jgi:hypothetical protein
MTTLTSKINDFFSKNIDLLSCKMTTYISHKEFAYLYKTLKGRRRAVSFLNKNYYLVTKSEYIIRLEYIDLFVREGTNMSAYDSIMKDAIRVLIENEDENKLAQELCDYVFLGFISVYKDLYDILVRITELRPRQKRYSSAEEIEIEHRMLNTQRLLNYTPICKDVCKHISHFLL